MPKTPIPIVALERLPHRGRVVEAGESLEVTPVEALAYTYQGRARYATAGELEARRPSKRTYRRRDMVAE